MADVARQNQATVEIVVKSLVFSRYQDDPFHEDVVFYIQMTLKVEINALNHPFFECYHIENH